MFSPKKILVATDFTGESENALKNAKEIADKFGSEITLLHVMDDIDLCVADFCLSIEQVESSRKAMAENASKKMKDEIRKTGVGKVTEIVRVGNVIEEIVKEVQDKKFDLLVIAPHAKHKIWHIFVAHLTDELAKKAKCKVLLVKE